jgi:hypothetical protein
MNSYRMLVVAGMVLIQVSGANAQFGGLGNLINKKANDLNKPTNPPPPADSNTSPTNLPASDQTKTTTATAKANSANESATTGSPKETAVSDVKKSDSSLPPIFQAIEQCDGVQFAELVKQNMASVNKAVTIREEYPDGKWKNIRMTPLEYASKYGCTNIISQLLDFEVAVTPNASKLAAANGRVEAIKMLLKAKAYPQDGMKEAIQNGHIDAMQALRAGGADMLKEIYPRTFSGLVSDGKVEMLQFLLKHLPKKSYQSYIHDGLEAAERDGKLDMVKIFVADGEKIEKEDIQLAVAANQPEMVAYLKETKKAQESAAANQSAAAEKEKADKEAAAHSDFVKKVKETLDHPTDLFGMASSRYRKFNGKVYDCAEPIEFLNRLYAFLPIESGYSDKPSSFNELKDQIEAESKWIHGNPWFNIQNDCSMIPVQVKQVISDGLIAQLNDASLVLLKNHPKQKTFVDGSVMAEPIFVIKTSPYQYTDVLGAVRTIPAYDMGVVVPTPTGSVPKLPLPDAGR